MLSTFIKEEFSFSTYLLINVYQYWVMEPYFIL